MSLNNLSLFSDSTMTGRVQYVDKIKGMTIILVVMGHVLEKSLGINDTIANMAYGSFHMPLFMFLSGIFAMKGFCCWSFQECFTFLKKKFLRIIIPFLMVGGFLSLCKYGNFWTVLLGHDNSSFWFLPALFYCMILEMLIGLIVYKLKSGWVGDVIL